MNLHNLFESTDKELVGSNYAEQLADQIFKVAPNLDASGKADEVLDYAFDLAVHDLGRKRARALFAYDEDFDGDLVTTYAYLQRQSGESQLDEVSSHGDDCHLCKGTGEGLFDGESCPVCDGTGIEPKSRDDDDFDPPDDYDDADYGDDESYYEKYVRTKNLEESVFLREDRRAIYEQWNKVGKRLVEYRLSPQQVQDLFNRIEQASTAAGGNRTMVGRGVDKAAELNNAWEELKGQIQQSRPVKGFDDLYDTAAAKLKTATGGDKGVMQYVNKYRAFAKEHPYIQSAVYAALIAAAGLSGAGLGGAGALGLLKMTDRLLQGDKASSALYKGAKTGALAMAAHSIVDYFKNPNAAIPPGTPAKLPDGTDYVVQKGDTLSQIAQKNGVSVKDLMAANNGATTTTDLTTQGWNNSYYDAFNNQNAMGDYTGPQPHEYATTTNPKLTNPDVLSPGQHIKVPGSLGPTQTYADNVGTAADTWGKVKSGEYTPSEISRNQAAKWNLPGAGEYNPPGGAGAAIGDTSVPPGARMSPDYLQQVVNGSHPKPMISPQDAQKALDWQAQNGGQAASSVANAGSNAAKGFSKEYLQQVINGTHPRPMISPEQAKDMLSKMNESKQLSESRIHLIFSNVVAGQKKLNEGVWDSIKGAAAKAGQWAQTKGHNLTTKVTLDKLLQAWNKANKTSDSEELITKVLLPAGVSQQVIDSVFAAMKIPRATAPAQQTGVAGRIEPTMGVQPATTPAPKTVIAKQQMPANPQWNYASASKASGVTNPTTAVKTAQPAALPSWADPKSGDYVGRREVARRQAAQSAKPAAPTTPQWGASTGAYSQTADRGAYSRNTETVDEDNGVKFAAEVGSKALGNANMGLLIKAYNAKTPRITLHFGNRSVDLDNADIEAVAQYYDEQLSDPTDRWDFIYKTMSNPDQLTAILAKVGRRSQKAVQQPGLFQEADKKKDDEEFGQQVRDVTLKRAISRAKSDFPTAGSGIEALAKDFMRSQDQDQTSFDQIRQAERQQDKMLAQISKIDQEQEQEIRDLDNQNSTLSKRLQQLHTVNQNLEKKLASMSGRKEKRKSAADTISTTSAPTVTNTNVGEPITKGAEAPVKTEPTSAKAPKVSYTIKPPKAQPKAKAEPKALAPTKAPPSINRFRNADIQDIAHRMLDIPHKSDELEKTAAAEIPALQNQPSPTMPTDANKKQIDLFAAENKEKEAKYGNKYQDMVARVGQKAKKQEQSKPVDIANLARRLAAIEASHKDSK